MKTDDTQTGTLLEYILENRMEIEEELETRQQKAWDHYQQCLAKYHEDKKASHLKQETIPEMICRILFK